MRNNRQTHPPDPRNKSLGAGLERQKAVVKKIAVILQNTAAEELSCDQFSDLIDEYIDLGLQGDDAAELMPLIKLHLDLCGGCREEFDALMRILNREMVRPATS